MKVKVRIAALKKIGDRVEVIGGRECPIGMTGTITKVCHLPFGLGRVSYTVELDSSFEMRGYYANEYDTVTEYYFAENELRVTS